MAIQGSDDGSPIRRANARQIPPMTALVKRPHKRHPELDFRAQRVFLNLRNAAEGKKRNLLHWQVV